MKSDDRGIERHADRDDELALGRHAHTLSVSPQFDMSPSRSCERRMTIGEARRGAAASGAEDIATPTKTHWPGRLGRIRHADRRLRKKRAPSNLIATLKRGLQRT